MPLEELLEKTLNMKIVEHYINLRNPNKGTFRLDWTSQDGVTHRLRGIQYFLKEGSAPFIQMPFGEGYVDHQKQTGRCKFPIYEFGSQEEYSLFRKTVEHLLVKLIKDKGLMFDKEVERKLKKGKKELKKPLKKPFSPSNKPYAPPGSFSTTGKPKIKPNAFVDMSAYQKGR